MLGEKVENWLHSQNRTAQPNDYRCELFTADNAERITFWNAVALGPMPTQEQLDAAPVPVIVPQQVSSAQAKLAIFNAGLFDTITAAVNADSYKAVQIYWDSAAVFERNHPYILGIAAGLGLDDATVDNLFVAAGKLV